MRCPYLLATITLLAALGLVLVTHVLGQNVNLEPQSQRKRTPEFAHSLPDRPNEPDGFTISAVRFDESMGEKKTIPRIPKTWKFIGVSSGEKLNSNNLWFQDADGSIYLAQGFITYGKFILNEEIHKITAK